MAAGLVGGGFKFRLNWNVKEVIDLLELNKFSSISPLPPFPILQPKQQRAINESNLHSNSHRSPNFIATLVNPHEYQIKQTKHSGTPETGLS
jgi:hypothetical protein